MNLTIALGHALWMAFAMLWEILWPLILGFGLSAVVQAVVSKSEMTKLLPDDAPKSLAIACALGAASSSCSYAAVALARSIFRKGANFTAAMAFQLASTNLVAELTIIIIVLMGWQFAAAEFLGGGLMVVLMALLFRMVLPHKLVAEAHAQAERGLKGKMEGHAEMDMSVTEGSLWERIRSKDGFTATSHYFVMDLAAVWKDIAGGLLIAGALAAWVPADFWKEFFLVSHPIAAKIWGPIVGPIVAIFSFVCSVGNVPLAAVLWNGGISFGGVIAFIYADLIILPIINIYRKYYGWKVAGPYRCDFLYCHGFRCPGDRVPVRPAGADSVSTKRSDRRNVDQLQLHDRSEHCFPCRCCASSRTIFQDRRAEDACAHGVKAIR